MILLSRPLLRQVVLTYLRPYPVSTSASGSAHCPFLAVMSYVPTNEARPSVSLTGGLENGWTASLAGARIGLTEIRCPGSATEDIELGANISATVPSPAGPRPEAS